MQDTVEGSLNGVGVSTAPPVTVESGAFSPPPTDPAPVTPNTVAQNIQRPSETFLQADIDRSVDYRKEYYKYALGTSTALLAFTMSFQPTLRVMPEYTYLEVVGWIGLGLSTAAGVRVHMVWSKFYATFQKYDNKGLAAEGQVVREKCNFQRRRLDAILIIGLIVGVVGVIGFTAINLKNVALKTDESAFGQKDKPQQSTASPTPNETPISPPRDVTKPNNPRS